MPPPCHVEMRTTKQGGAYPSSLCQIWNQDMTRRAISFSPRQNTMGIPPRRIKKAMTWQGGRPTPHLAKSGMI